MKNRLNLIKSKPIFRMKLPSEDWRQPFFFIAENNYIQGFINIVIFINTIVLSL